jgi:hypothetical protein
VYGFGGRNKLESEKFTCKIDLDCRFFFGHAPVPEALVGLNGAKLRERNISVYQRMNQERTNLMPFGLMISLPEIAKDVSST